MTDFKDHLKNSNTTHDAAIAFFRALRAKGVHINPSRVPSFVEFKMDGQASSMIQTRVANIIAPNFEHAEDLVHQLATFGYHVDYATLVKDPIIYGRNIHHERTLAEFRARYSTRRGNTSSTSEIREYFEYLTNHQIKLSAEKRIGMLLSKEHQAHLQSPDFILDVALQTKNFLLRCKSGYSEIHSDRHRFILADKLFYEDYEGLLERKAGARDVRISDGICKECYPIYLQRVLDMPFPKHT